MGWGGGGEGGFVDGVTSSVCGTGRRERGDGVVAASHGGRGRVEGTLNAMDHLQVTGLAGRGEDKEEALGMLECLNAFGMTEMKEDIEMEGM